MKKDYKKKNVKKNNFENNFNPENLLTALMGGLHQMTSKLPDEQKNNITNMMQTADSGIGSTVKDPKEKRAYDEFSKSICKDILNGTNETIETLKEEVNKKESEEEVNDVSDDSESEPKNIENTKKIEEYKIHNKNYKLLPDNTEVDILDPITDDIVINLDVTLEELYNGTTKKIEIERDRIKKGSDGKYVVVKEKKKLVVPIQRGSYDEQVIRYNRQASEKFEHETGDIVVVLKQNGHPFYERKGDDLFLTLDIGIYESYAYPYGLESLKIPHISSKDLLVDFTSDDNSFPLHTNGAIRKINGLGMPKRGTDEYGSLYIRFNVLLPDSFDDNKLGLLKKYFPMEHNVSSYDIDKMEKVSMVLFTNDDFKKLKTIFTEYSSDEESSSSGSEDSNNSYVQELSSSKN